MVPKAPFTVFKIIELMTIFSEFTVNLSPLSLNWIVRRTGSDEEKVTPANLITAVSMVSTGAMLTTSKTAVLIASGSAAWVTLSELSCIPVSLSVCVLEELSVAIVMEASHTIRRLGGLYRCYPHSIILEEKIWRQILEEKIFAVWSIADEG